MITLKIDKVDYLGDYQLKLFFNDGKIQKIDFAHFIKSSLNPAISKYQDLSLFKAYRLTDGDLEWGDFDLCFPIADLYDNCHIETPSPEAA
ncbi:DUF2442 domain-containing protein [Thiomicrospira sp. ALE5]|uniref:DUF2442 domain-containing protein n=1 Tax=Thiomicrospira sp. ALE5 TaxID=748650 RepID=UPI0008E7347A|nr:DUF2442 domain-containing protein [Thiomicrospira sp. ALE5]SFR53425.1 Protein of unknown function [Thiomicrospira sp. ALE5]